MPRLLSGSKNAFGCAALGLLVMAASACSPVGDARPDIASWAERPADADELYQARVAQLERDQGRIEYDILGPIASGAAEQKLARQSTTGINPAALAAIREYSASNDSSALLVWHKDAIVEESYFGDSNAQSLLPSKSLSKPLASIAIGRAIALGLIEGLDQKASDFITEWQSTPKQDMTLRDILWMQSGLLEQSFDLDPDGPLMRAYVDPYHERYIVDEYPLTDEPGTRYAYSNATGDLTAVIIERASGKDYAEFVGEEILAPLAAADGEAWINRPDGKSRSGCCMFFTAETYLKFARLLLDDGMIDGERLLPQGFVAAMRTGSPYFANHGMGLWLGEPYRARRSFLGAEAQIAAVLQNEPFLAADTFMFDGNGHQVTYIVPSQDLIVLRLGNRPSADGAEWDNSVLLNTVLRGISASQ
ncbi:MAG: serine hydrolase domain-containing protein [Erythrobacter sp.]